MEKQSFTIINHFSIIQIIPNTKAALAWLRENTQSEGWQWLGNTLCIEPRYAGDILSAIESY